MYMPLSVQAVLEEADNTGGFADRCKFSCDVSSTGILFCTVF